MTRHRRSLEAIRAQLASIQMVNVEPATVEALTDALDELDDLIVDDLRVEQWVNDASADSLAQPFDMARLAEAVLTSPKGRMAVVIE